MKEVILVTGGTGILGSVFVANLLRRGNSVALTCRRSESVESLIDREGLHKYKDKIYPIVVDYSGPGPVEVIIQALDVLRLDVKAIIHNARSLDTLQPNEEGRVTSENFVEEFKIGVVVPYQLTLELKDRGNLENVIFISSIYGVVTPTLTMYNSLKDAPAINYSVTKAAQIHLTKELANRLAKNQIRVNCISYGGIAGRAPKSFVEIYSKHAPQSRMIERDEIFGIVEFLLGAGSTSITGQNYQVDGGWTLS